MPPRYKYFWARAFPGKHAVKKDRNLLDPQSKYYVDLTPEEARTVNMRGMPLSINHVMGIKSKEGEGDKPMEITYPKNSNVLGRIVDQITLDDGTILALGEIVRGGPGESLPERALKDTAVSLIENGHYAVSLCHSFDQHYRPSEDANVVRKYPLEMALTMEPYREGAEVLSHYDATEPFSVAENKYDVYRAGCRSTLNYAAIDNKDYANQMSTAPNTNAATAAPAAAPPGNTKKFTDEEINKLLNDYHTMKSDVDRLRPLADEYLRKKKDEDDAQRKSVVDNVKKMHEDAQKLMSMLLESGIDIPEQDRANIQTMVTAAEKQKPETEALVTELVTNDAREKNANPSPTDLYRNLDNLLAQTVIPSIVACSRVIALSQPVLQKQAADQASKARAAGKPGAAAGAASTSAPPTASQPAMKKMAEPKFTFDFNALAAAQAAALKKFETPDNDDVE